ncbi:MAG TPA: hypothetical protein VKP11_10675 [Frankiaceae bacterium]|nr:hypothetical protein [Frankiaceae bacterium]
MTWIPGDLGSSFLGAVDVATGTGCSSPLPAGAIGWRTCPGSPGHPAGDPLFGPRTTPWNEAPTSTPAPQIQPSTSRRSEKATGSSAAYTRTTSSGSPNVWTGIPRQWNTFWQDPVGAFKSMLPH